MFKRILIIVIVLLQACKPIEKMTKHTSVKDSISVKTTLVPRDTIVKIPADSVTIKTPLSAITEKPIVKKSRRSTLSIKRVGNTIETKCKTPELEKIIELQDRLIELYKSKEVTNNSTITIPVRYVPKLIKVLAWIGRGFLLLISITIVLRIKNII